MIPKYHYRIQCGFNTVFKINCKTNVFITQKIDQYIYIPSQIVVLVLYKLNSCYGIFTVHYILISRIDHLLYKSFFFK